MKLSYVSFTTAISCLVSTGSAFHVQTPSQHRTSVTLEASRRAQKIASRTKWLEARGFSATGVTESTAQAGMMQNDDGLEFVRLVSPNGSMAEIYLFGGVVTSYKDSEGTEFIAVRPDAKMDGSKPISGGLSHCWPQVRSMCCSSCVCESCTRWLSSKPPDVHFVLLRPPIVWTR